MFEFFGHLHPLFVHLPIGILLLACFFQLISSREKYIHLEHAISITLFWGMISAVASCITGYILSNSGDYDEELVGRHQWLGISVAVVSIIYYLLYHYRSIIKYKWVLPVLLIFLIAVTGHLGGSLTHGSDYLTGSFKSIIGADTVLVKKPIPDVQEAIAYTDIIQPLLQSKCYNCHGANKQKGKLRMDLAALLMKGGKDGVVIEPGKADESEMIKRILLEKADEHHMPPKEKPQLSEKEIAILHWWIASGASFDKKTKDLAQTDKIKPILLSLQNTAVEKKAIMDVPVVPVEKGDEAAIKKLTDSGVVVMPVAANSNYLMVSFVTKANANDSMIQLLLPLKKQLVWLKLNGTKITDAAITVIKECSNLTRLELSNTGITDEGISRLITLRQLQSLNLVGTKVTMSGLMKLKDVKELQSIYFYKTAVKNTDWEELKKAFPKVKLDSGGYQVPLFGTDTMLVKPPPKIQQ
ncbi:MAG: c-type cytochrome domain-containing protein [Bacteroidota bacterium]